MPKIHPGRYSASIDGDFVVFLIGMRLNRPRRVRRLPWFMRTIPGMLQELETTRHPSRPTEAVPERRKGRLAATLSY